MNNGRRSTLVALGIVLVFLLAWEASVTWMRTPVYILPSPSRVLQTLAANAPDYSQASLVTLGEALAGLFFGLVGGCLLACLLTLQPGLEGGVMTLAILLKSTPMVAIAPLLTLWLGFGVTPKVIITALLTFFPVLVNVLSGLQRPDPALLDLFRAWQASRWEIFLRLRAPSALPYLFAALKISAPLAKWADPGWISFHTPEQFRTLLSGAGFQRTGWIELLPGFGIAMGQKAGVQPRNAV